MTVYKYSGINKKGEQVKGRVEADDERGARNSLLSQGIRSDKIKKDWTQLDLSTGGVSGREIVIFTRQFATMINAGLSIIQGLDILANQAESPAFRKVLRKVKNSVEEGKSLSDSLGEHPAQFDELYVNLVAAGEVGGILDTILDRLAIYLEKNMKLKKRVKGAMAYPSVILVVTIAVIALLLIKVVPTFAGMFAASGQKLPGLTQMIVDMSDFARAYWFPILGIIVGIGIGIKFAIKNEKVRYFIHKAAISAPIFGPVIKKVAVARFTRTLGTLVSSGVPLVEGLNVVAKTAGNKIVENGILYVREKVMEGSDMTTPLTEAGIFPPMVVQMIGVGEATGAMDTMLNKIADFYEEEVDVAVAALTSMLEPVMMVVIGGVVGTTLVAMYLPIFSMANAIG